MYFFSKLANSDINIFEFRDNHIQDDETIVYNKTNSTFNHKSYFEGKSIKGKHFLLQHIVVSVDQEESLHYIQEGDLLSLSFVVRGDFKCLKECNDFTFSNGQVSLSKLTNYRLTGKLFFNKNSINEIIHLQLHKEYVDQLLDEYNWLSNINQLKHILSDQKEGLYNCIIPCFNLKTFHLLLDLIDINAIPHHKSDYVKLKFKELFFLLSTHDIGKTSADYQEMYKVKAFIEQNYFEDLSLEYIANHFNISQSTLKKKFKEEVGSTLHQYIVDVKMSKAIRLLNKDIYVNELSNHLGFHSVSHFIKVFKKYYGYTPKEYLLFFKQNNSNN